MALTSQRIAVIGGGIAGLSAAYELARLPGVSLTLYEASTRLGGTVETVTLPSASGEPFVIEGGPDSWVSEKAAARELALELGLADELIYSNDALRRTYLASNGHGGNHAVRGHLTPMPDGMRMMVPTRWAPVLESPLFSWQARLAYLREPRRAAELKQHALAQNADPDADESVASFVRRHFGEEATQTIAGPLLAGVFGGDIETLSARAVLAPFVRMEQEHGSLIRAVMARTTLGQPEPLFTTLKSGLQTLIDRMAATVAQGSLRLGCRVTSLRQAASARWQLSLETLDTSSERVTGDPHPAPVPQETFDAVILATPAHVTRELLAPLDPQAAALLPREQTSAIVVALAWQPAQAAGLRMPRGFGFLVPPSSPGRALSNEPSLLAGTFMDQKFRSRAPRGAVLLRGFFGGPAAPRMMDWPDEAIAERACAQFARLLGRLPEPSYTLVRRWPRSLPQYSVGHLSRMRALHTRIEQLKGLGLAGNAYEGVGLAHLVEQGRAIARTLANRTRLYSGLL